MMMEIPPVPILDSSFGMLATGDKPKAFIKKQTLPYKGSGYISSKFPDAITSVEGVPVIATVRVIYRSQTGDIADGAVVAEVQSNPDGTWRVDGLNPNLLYDVVGRIANTNDIIMSQIKPIAE